jgi:hypothetical protein
MDTWEKVKEYFEPAEFDDPKFPGSGEKHMDRELVEMLFKLRVSAGWPIITHAKAGGCVDVEAEHGHAMKSYHLVERGAMACDFHFKTEASVREQIFRVLRGGFTGVGLYYDWSWGKPFPVGFHVDRRPIEQAQIWTRKEGKYIYFLAQ